MAIASGGSRMAKKRVVSDRTKFTSKSQMAKHLGVNRNTIIAWTGRSDFPAGSAGPWYLDEVFPWSMARRETRTGGDEPEMNGPLSPGLERFRLARASHAELDLAERRSALVSRERVRAILGRWAVLLRGAGETLGRRFGKEAQTVLNETLDDCQKSAHALAAADAERAQDQTAKTT